MAQLIQTLLPQLSRWFAQAPVAELNEAFADVPPGVLNSLSDQLGKLPTPEPYRVTIRRAFRKALHAWQANPETASNSLVVLSRPVEAIAPMLKQSFQEDLTDCDVRFFLSAYQRPLEPLTISDHLQRELEPEKTVDKSKPAAPVTESDIEHQVPIVMVIPSLEQCFLRCIQGWEGIEYLQTLATQDTSRFWVFGCNHWAWTFLDKVCQVSAYLEQVVALPELTGEELQAWLQPLMETAIATQTLEPLTVQITTHSDSYWNTLANLSVGIGTSAAHLWLKSLKIDTADLTDEGTLPGGVAIVNLSQTKPLLISLITLEVMDRYLLHSLLLHGEMTRSHLAESLGEAERTIRSRVQVLRREGILVQKGRRLSVHPAYYPRLYSELGNNSFLIGEA